MNCELCGKIQENLVKINIEGSKALVCNECQRMGTRSAKVTKKSFKNEFLKKSDSTQILKKDYAKIIKNNRQKKYDQETFAKKIGQKLSVVQRIEQGTLKPPSKICKVIEKELNVKLLDEYKEENIEEFSNKKSGPLTIADIIKFKK